MQYYSLHHQSPPVDFREATLRGQAPDKGLYFPSEIPPFDDRVLDSGNGLSREEIAFAVMQPFTGDTIPADVLMRIVSETISFPFPLVKVTDNIYALELFHGPTLAFKDVGARFMSRCLGYFSRNASQKNTVLVATSGDTGGAVANGFAGVEGVEVVILYPSGKVSPVQELQLTTCGGNITALEVAGSFDDCQAMVKDAFMDEALRASRNLTSANSINVARWLPQQLYYVLARRDWQGSDSPVISVPSGNFGNLCAGLLACRRGLSVNHFVAACNANDAVAQYLQTGRYAPQTAVATLSNAMDVGNPSNFIRMLKLFANDYPAISRIVTGISVSDDDTKAAITDVYKRFGYTLDPHGAVAFLALNKYLSGNTNAEGIFLETAHPVKFPGVVEEATGNAVSFPAEVQALLSKTKQAEKIAPEYTALKEYLMR